MLETPGLATVLSGVFTNRLRSRRDPAVAFIGPAEAIQFAEAGNYVRVIDGRTGATRAWLVPPGDVPAVVDELGDDAAVIRREVHDRNSRSHTRLGQLVADNARHRSVEAEAELHLRRDLDHVID